MYSYAGKIAFVFARVMRPRKQEEKPGGERSATSLASRSKP
jgi:hypothetical protein